MHTAGSIDVRSFIGPGGDRPVPASHAPGPHDYVRRPGEPKLHTVDEDRRGAYCIVSSVATRTRLEHFALGVSLSLSLSLV